MMTSSQDNFFASDQRPKAEHTSERKRRKDADQPRWQGRDYYALEWIGEQGVIRYDQLRILLGRESPGKVDFNAVLSPSATDNALHRWETKSFVNSAHIIPGEMKYY